MSTPKRIFTLSAGSQTVSLAEFRPTKRGGLQLFAFETRELLADPAADATRISQTALALGEMVESLKAKGGVVRLTLPAQSTFSRMVKVPAMSGADLEQTVMFEAKQNIPYPLEEVVWDHRVVYETEAHEPEVLISAAKSDLLEECTAAVSNSGLQPAGIELATAALYNAFRYNYGDPEGCVLLIDLGARTTNLIFIEPGRFFIRTISSGGSALTAAVAKEFNERFSEAEARKLASGFIGRGSSFEEPEDPDQAKLSKVLRNAATRLHAEVTRSISFYRSQQSGANPQRIYLCGNGSRIPLMAEFWEEKLSVPVESFNPLRCIDAAQSSDANSLVLALPQLGEHVGLALNTLLHCPVSINLLPPALRRKSKIGQLALVICLVSACVGAPLFAWAFQLKREAELAQEIAEKITPQINAVKELDRKIKLVRQQMDANLKLSKPLETAVLERRYWASLLDQLHAALPPEYVWITSIEVPPPNPNSELDTSARGGATKGSANAPAAPVAMPRLLIKGLYLENPRNIGVVDDFGRALVLQGKLSKEYFSAEEKLRTAQLNGAKEEIDHCEKLFQAARSAIIEAKLPLPPILFNVTPVEDWVRTNKPNPSEWAQDFAIPLELVAPPPVRTQISIQ